MATSSDLLLSEKIYRDVRWRILEALFLPREHIPLRVLETAFQCTYAPASEALRRLTQEGYVRRDPRGNHYVRAWDDGSISDAFSFWGRMVSQHVADLDLSGDDPLLASLREMEGILPAKPGGLRSDEESDRFLAFYATLVDSASDAAKKAVFEVMPPALFCRALRSLPAERFAYHAAQRAHIISALADGDRYTASLLILRQSYDLQMEAAEDMRRINAADAQREVSFLKQQPSIALAQPASGDQAPP